MGRALGPLGCAALWLLVGRSASAQVLLVDELAADRLWRSRVEALAPSGRLWLRVRARHASTGNERKASFAGLELGGGLDALLGAGTLEAPPALAEPAGAAAGASPLLSTPAPLPAPGNTPALASPATRHRPKSEPPELSIELSRAIIAKARAVVEASTRPTRLDSMASRARAAAALPEVRLGAGTSEDESLRFAPTIDDPARFTRDGGRDIWFEARLTWQLDRAVFARDELAIERARADAEERKQRTIVAALAALEQWQRAWLTQRSELASPSEIDKAILAEVAAAAQLDAFTDGWFSRWLAERRAEGLRPEPSSPPLRRE